MPSNVTRHQPSQPPLCPSCHEPLTIQRRGSDWFAYCRGPHGWDGCVGVAEFGETDEEAVEAVYEQRDINDL